VNLSKLGRGLDFFSNLIADVWSIGTPYHTL
jgi:hypothetical protein